MQQIVDLENDPKFIAQNVALLSIAQDSLGDLSKGAQEYGIVKTPLLSDPNREVATSYDVLKWALETGEPGHTFILVDQNGKIAWIKDYGAPNNPDRTMYVPIEELTKAIQENLTE